MPVDPTSPLEVNGLAWVPPSAHENLAGYVRRGTARPAFRRAMQAQLAALTPDHESGAK